MSAAQQLPLGIKAPPVQSQKIAPPIDAAATRQLFKDLGRKVVKDWQGWKDLIWESMHRNLNPEGLPGIAGLACLEQYMRRSAMEKRCIECGEPGTVAQDRTESSLIQSVPRYWMCAECHTYWEHKGCTHRSHKRCGVAS